MIALLHMSETSTVSPRRAAHSFLTGRSKTRPQRVQSVMRCQLGKLFEADRELAQLIRAGQGLDRH